MNWDTWTIFILVIFVIVIIVMSTAIALSHEHGARQRCGIICHDHNMTFLGLSGGRCVCSPNMVVRFYFKAGNNQTD